MVGVGRMGRRIECCCGQSSKKRHAFCPPNAPPFFVIYACFVIFTGAVFGVGLFCIRALLLISIDRQRSQLSGDSLLLRYAEALKIICSSFLHASTREYLMRTNQEQSIALCTFSPDTPPISITRFSTLPSSRVSSAQSINILHEFMHVCMCIFASGLQKGCRRTKMKVND